MSGTLRGEIWGLSFAIPHSVYMILYSYYKYRQVFKNDIFAIIIHSILHSKCISYKEFLKNFYEDISIFLSHS